MITILPVKGIPDVKRGDDIAKLITSSIGKQKLDLQTGDILVIAQKIVSKAE